jgi:hypothetical protein
MVHLLEVMGVDERSRLPIRRCDGVTPSILGAFGRVESSSRVITVRVPSLAMPSARFGSLLLDREELFVSLI